MPRIYTFGWGARSWYESMAACGRHRVHRSLTEEELETLVLSLMSPVQKESYIQNNQVDLAASDRDGNRVRVNVYKAMGQISIVMRLIAKDIPTPGGARPAGRSLPDLGL